MKRKTLPILMAIIVTLMMTACELKPISFENPSTDTQPETSDIASPTPAQSESEIATSSVSEPATEPESEASSEDLSGITDKFTLLLKGGLALGEIEMKDYSDCESVLIDIDRDNEDELFLRTDANTSYLIDKNEDHLYIIYKGDGLTKPVVEGKYSGLMYYREGGEPYHETYKYITFDYDGNIFEETYVEWYDMNKNDEQDKSDGYLLFYDDFTETVKMDKWISEYGEITADIKSYFA